MHSSSPRIGRRTGLEFSFDLVLAGVLMLGAVSKYPPVSSGAAHTHAVVSGAGRAPCGCFGDHVPAIHGVMARWTSVCLLGCWIRYHRVWAGVGPDRKSVV